jgi:hypothetical protein
MAATSERFLWVCELNENEPMKKWVPGNVLEFEDEDDSDFVCNSLIVKTAVLGENAKESERNLVAIKTTGYPDKKEFEQPIFSLTLGRNDMISGLDLTVAADHNQEVEFKLVKGTGPVFITCMHLVEVPTNPNEEQTMMTNSEIEDEEADEMAAEVMDEDEAKTKRIAAMKNGVKNGNGKIANGNGALKEAQQA